MVPAPFVPIIPAGGSGTRLWPLSRRAYPKFLLDLTGSGRSLLQQTLDRLAPLADAPPLVVTGIAHADAVRTQLAEAGHGSARVVAEPSPRNSMPAIALAAALVEREFPDAVIGSFAADHLIEDVNALVAAVTAARAAAEEGRLVTLGIRPTGPSTAFGYIEMADDSGNVQGEEMQGDELGASAAQSPADTPNATTRPGGGAGPVVLPVTRFVEKPDRARAQAFLDTGRFLWNAGMFVVRATVLLDELSAQIPPLTHGARELAAAHGTEAWADRLEQIWPTLTAIAIDYALAEPLAAAGRVSVVPADLGWDDVGDFAALARQLRAGTGTQGSTQRTDTAVQTGDAHSDVHVLGHAVVDAVSSRATVYGSPDRPLALVGLEGISIVDTEDALLVLADDRAQELAALVARLEERGRGHLR